MLQASDLTLFVYCLPAETITPVTMQYAYVYNAGFTR